MAWILDHASTWISHLNIDTSSGLDSWSWLYLNFAPQHRDFASFFTETNRHIRRRGPYWHGPQRSFKAASTSTIPKILNGNLRIMAWILDHASTWISHHINSNYDVEGLSKGFASRLQQLVDAKGQRLKYWVRQLSLKHQACHNKYVFECWHNYVLWGRFTKDVKSHTLKYSDTLYIWDTVFFRYFTSVVSRPTLDAC
jgi:hypothetical protein